MESHETAGVKNTEQTTSLDGGMFKSFPNILLSQSGRSQDGMRLHSMELDNGPDVSPELAASSHSRVVDTQKPIVGKVFVHLKSVHPSESFESGAVLVNTFNVNCVLIHRYI